MASNPFITQAPATTMGVTPEALQLQRQQQFAAALLNQAGQSPQGQTVSGRFVAPSWTQQLSSAINPLVGAYMMKQADTKQTELAKALREEGVRDIGQYMGALQGKPESVTYSAEDVGPSMNVTPATGPDYNRALSIALSSRSPIVQALGAQTIGEMTKPQKLGEGEQFVRFNPNSNKYETIASGAEKFRAPLQIDTGTSIELRDPRDPTKVLQVIPKAQGGQIYESSEGPLIVNTKTNTATPLLGADGKPLSPKLSSEQSKDITAINQQKAVISSALDLVRQNPSAFSFKRGAAVLLPFGETLAGRTETAPETESRAAVFNIVSKVINERAGAAQSAQEMKRLNAFLPSEFDNAKKIQDKLNGFNKYLEEQEKGVRASTSKIYTPTSASVFANEADAQKAFNEGKLKVGQKITINGVTGTWQ